VGRRRWRDSLNEVWYRTHRGLRIGQNLKAKTRGGRWEQVNELAGRPDLGLRKVGLRTRRGMSAVGGEVGGRAVYWIGKRREGARVRGSRRDVKVFAGRRELNSELESWRQRRAPRTHRALQIACEGSHGKTRG
jgi:hypothetical protein